MTSGLRVFALLVTTGVASSMHAASLTYTTTFSGTTDTCTGSCTGQTASGTGTFTLNAGPASIGTTTYAASDVTGLSFMVGMTTFTTGLSDIVFTNGALSSIDFSGSFGGRGSMRTLTISGLNYSFSAPTSVVYDPTSGSVSANPAAAATPEPSSLMLLGTGLVCVMGAVRRRFIRS